MGWPATVRYGIDPAPGGLALVQDLLNTAPTGPSERTPVELVLTETDLDGLRTFRDGLRLVVTGNNGGDAARGAGGSSGREAWSLPLASMALRLGGDGQVRVEPRDKGWRAIAAVALIEVMEAQRVDTWRRLKTCRNRSVVRRSTTA